MRPSLAELASALIAVFEGPASRLAFRDPGGVWTIGRGHTAGVKEGDTCTDAQSDAWFAEDEAPLLGMPPSSLPLAARAAYVDFGYNCGAGALARVLAGADTISNPVHTTDARGIVLPGLVSRRRLEALLIACSA